VGNAPVAVNSNRNIATRPLGGTRVLRARQPNMDGSRAKSRLWAGAYRRAQFIVLGSHSEISGKAISSVMIITSQPRNQKQPLKIVSNGI
jgi:hypothetical protein